MEIEEQHVFRFVFPFMGDKATFNVVADSQKDAANKIRVWMQNTLIELSVVFPNEVPQTETPKKLQAMEEVRITDLIKELGKFVEPMKTTEETVKSWLNLEYEQGNWPLIIDGLEKLKTAYETGKIKKAGR